MQGASESSGKLQTLAVYCIIGLLAGLFLFPFVRVLTWCPDEGIYLYASAQVAHGAIPGRDFVQENAPGAYYWLAWFFKLFGTSFLTARALLLVTGVATALLIFHLSRRAGGTGLFAATFFLVTGIPLMVMNSPHYDSNLFAFASFAVFLAAGTHQFGTRSHYWLLTAAGLLAGWTSCILQQKGLLFALAFAITLFLLHGKRAIRPAIALASGYAVVLFAMIGIYAYNGTLSDLFLSAVKLPLSSYQHLNAAPYGFLLWNVMIPRWFAFTKALLPIWIAAPVTGLFSAPFLLAVAVPAAVAVLGYMYRREAFRPLFLPYWVTAYAMWLSELHRQDIGHLRNGCLLLVVLFFVLLEKFGNGAQRFAMMLICIGIVLNGTVYVMAAMSARTVIQSRRGALLAQEKDPALEFLLRHTQPGDYAFVYPYHPIYYFLADLRNPTRFSVLLYNHKHDPLLDEAMRDLDSRKPRYALSDTAFSGEALKTLFPAYEVPAPQDQLVERYLDSHYHQIAFENGFRILERNAP